MPTYEYPEPDDLKTHREANPTETVWQAIAETSIPGVPPPEISGIATQAEAEAGVVNNKWMSPLRTAQAINTLGSTDALPLAGGALDVDAEVTASISPDGNDRSVDTEFGGWGFGVEEKIDGTNTGTQATMEPDGFRAGSTELVESVIVSGITNNAEPWKAAWTGVVDGGIEVTIRAENTGLNGNNIVLTGDGTSSFSALIDAWNDNNPENPISTTITYDGDEESYTAIGDSPADGEDLVFSGGAGNGDIAGIMGWGDPSGTKWSDLNGTYVKTAVAVTPSAYYSGDIGMHTPVAGTFNYYLSNPLSMGEPSSTWNGIAYFLAPGNRSGWSDPNNDDYTDPPVNYWRLCVLSDWPYTYFTNPSSDPYTFPTTGWVPVSASAPNNNEGAGYNGANYLPNYAGGFSVATSSSSGGTRSTHLSSTALTFDNGSSVKKGKADAGIGGNGGVALKCSLEYELKWDGGRLFITEQDGVTIRRVEHCGDIVPTSNDDLSKGFVQGSQWVLDDGTVYVCDENTYGSAVWTTSGSELTLSKLTVNGNDAVAGQLQAIVLKGATFFGNEDGSLGIVVEGHSAFGEPAAVFTGSNQNLLNYKNVVFTAGYFPQFFLATNGKCGVQTTSPEATLDINGNLILRDTENGQKATYNTSETLTSDRVYSLPDKDGTIALTSNTPFIISVVTSQGNVNAINYINAAGGIGFSSNSNSRHKTMLQKCAIKKANVIVQQATGQTLTANDGSLTLMNITTGADHTIISGSLTADNTNTFRNHNVSNLNILLEENDVYQFRLNWPTTIPTQIRIVMDLFCYPAY